MVEKTDVSRLAASACGQTVAVFAPVLQQSRHWPLRTWCSKPGTRKLDETPLEWAPHPETETHEAFSAAGGSEADSAAEGVQV